MNRYISTFLLILAASISMNAQTVPAAAKLTALLNEFLAGAGRSDAAVHDRFWADDLIYTRSAGVRITKVELMKGLSTTPAPKPGDAVTVYSSEDVQIHQYGKAAVVAFKLVATTTRPDGARSVAYYLNTGTFIQRKDKWQAVAWQSTMVPKADPDARKP